MKLISHLLTALSVAWLMSAPLAAQQTQEDAPTTETAAVEVAEMRLGNPDADVTVVEYASFTCSHCGRFHTDVFKKLKTNYIDTGKINFVYREVYFDRPGLWAGMVARCGGQERYFGIVDLLYADQADWTQGAAIDVVGNLRRIGKLAGLTDETLDACLSDGAKAEAMVATFEENRQADDITSTPSFLINGKKHSNMSYADFAELIEAELGS